MIQSYQLIREIKDFDLLDFIPHLGWISTEVLHLKIYSLPGTLHFFLHDERSNRLFEFSAANPDALNSTQQYHEVIKYFKSIIPGLT